MTGYHVKLRVVTDKGRIGTDGNHGRDVYLYHQIADTRCSDSSHVSIPKTRVRMRAISEAAQVIGVHIEPRQIKQFRRYLHLIQSRGKRQNLTALTSAEDIVEELFIRSFRVAVPAGGSVSTASWFSGRNVIDIGSGAGIPGLPLKILLPESKLTLLDSNAKKCAFMEHVIDDLGLQEAVVLNARAEVAAHDPQYRHTFDLAIARGLASLPVLLEYSLPFLKPGGVAVLPKGPDTSFVNAEIDDAAYATQLLGGGPAFIQQVECPGKSPIDNIVYYLKLADSDSIYPRRVGVPTKRPLIRGPASV